MKSFNRQAQRMYDARVVIRESLIMSFQEFYTLGDEAHASTLGEIPENLYNTHDRKSAKEEVSENKNID